MSHPFAGLSSHNKPPLGTPIGFLNAGLPARQSLGNGIPPDSKSVSPRSDRSETQRYLSRPVEFDRTKHPALQMYFYTIVYGNQSQVRVLQEIWHFQPPVCLSATCHVETIVFACYQLDRIH